MIIDLFHEGKILIMNSKILKQKRIDLFKNSITGDKRPDRVFHLGNLWTWKITDAGYKLSEALSDYDKMENVLKHTLETYKIDCVYETGWRNPVLVSKSLGHNEYVYNDNTNSINIPDQCYMELEDYPALIADPQKFLWNTILPRKYPLFKKENNSGDFRNFLDKFGEFGAFMGRITQLQNNLGIPDVCNPNGPIGYCNHGYEVLFTTLRGIRGLSYDIRRDPEKVLAAIEALDTVFAIPQLERSKKQPKGTSLDYCVDSNPVLLGHIILSQKQFEKFYWPHLKRTIDMANNYDKLFLVFAEGASERFYNYFQEFPQKHFAFLGEMNDIFEMKKKLRNVTVVGGMTTDLLGKGTPQQCVDYAKKLIDELAYDGKYIFSANKMISFTYDCTRENLKTVSDFIADYKI